MHRSKYDGFFKVGEKFGDWTIESSDIVMDDRGRACVFCKCTSCGNEARNVACHHLVRGRTRKCNYCANSYKLRGYNNNPNWRGEDGMVPKTILTRISSSASHTGVPYNLSLNYVNTLYNNSDKKCAISGEALNFTKSVTIPGNSISSTTGGTSGWSGYTTIASNATLIPIDPELGYVENNVAWVNDTVAAMKSKCQSKDEFINICLAVAKQHQFKNKQQVGGSNEG